MENLGRRWAGSVYGTNTGNAFVELQVAEGGVQGTLRFQDHLLGLSVFDLVGVYADGTLTIEGSPQAEAPSGVGLGRLTMSARLSAEGHLRGDWQSSLGTAGTFVLFPHDGVVADVAPRGAPPEQLHTTIRQLGALRFYGNDIPQLIEFMGRDFRAPRVVVTYRDRGTEIAKYADQFLREANPDDRHHYLRLGVSEPEAYGLNRNVIIELNADGRNQVTVQGVQQAWVLGKAEVLAGYLKRHQDALASRIPGLTLANIFLIFVLLALPELPFLRRAVFLLAVVLVAWVAVRLRKRYLPTTLVYIGPRRPSALTRFWPQLLGGLISLCSGLAAAVAYGLLKGELKLPQIP